MHLDLCDDLVRRARAMGAADAEVFYRKARKLEAMFEKNDLQVPKGDTYEGVGIRVLIGGSNGARLGFAATNLLTSESLENALSAAMAIAHASPEDPNHSSPIPRPPSQCLASMMSRLRNSPSEMRSIKAVSCWRRHAARTRE